MGKIAICKAANSSAYLPQIDENEADADFICAVTENDADVYSILRQGSTVGLALLEGDRHAFVYLYIFPAYRHRGFGKAAALLLEQELDTRSTEDISTCCRMDDPIACAFAKNCGYRKEFSSDHMVYSGPRFERKTLPVRQYRDQDHLDAFSLEEEAFHLMRLSTGSFPDSVPAPPSEEMRNYWADTAKERLVYLDGDEIIGSAHVHGNEICSVSVKPGRQGQGIGKRFLQYIVNMLDRCRMYQHFSILRCRQ